ncbi:MAG: hypothetical protein GX881_06860, partial [Firmicutes bacterium]|nr:hypothetical protein [Bacillota bacterium]
MPIAPTIVGKKLPPLEFHYQPEEVMLYALGVGAGAADDELNFVYENELQVLPTFGVVPPFPALMGIIGLEGVDINLAMLLHGEQ